MNFRWLLALPLLLTGCTPESIVWAPNGKTGLISTQNATYLFDDKGKISEPLPGNPFGMTPGAWVPDTNNFVLVRSKPLATWTEIKEFIDENRRKGIESTAATVLSRLTEFSGELSEFTSNVPASRTDLVSAWIYLRDERGSDLEKIVKQKKDSTQAWSNVKSMKAQGYSIDLYEGHGLLFKTVRTIHRSLDAVFSLRLSPDGKWIAAVTESGSLKSRDLNGALPISTAGVSLSVMNVDNTGIRLAIDDKVGLWPTWSQDGKDLYYFHTNVVPTVNNTTSVMGRLRHAKLTLAEMPALESKDDLLDVLFNPFDKITSLASGDLLFISQTIELPRQRSDDVPEGRIVIFNPKQQARITKVEVALTPDQRRCLSQGGFSVSPDSTRIALTTTKGATDIIDLSTGKIQSVAVANPFDRPMPGSSKLPANFRPAWRSNDELVYRSLIVSPLNGMAEYQFILWSPEKSIILSKDWQPLNSEVASRQLGQ